MLFFVGDKKAAYAVFCLLKYLFADNRRMVTRYLVPFAFIFQPYAVPADLGNSPLAYDIGADLAFILQHTQDG